jgi:alginate O-acetyltransferase complex protein AlgI
MAMGVGEMLQIPLPLNFDSPYKSVKVTEIWSRWHMTLTRFFTRYVYIPLGGNRKGTGRMYANTFAVFVLSGIWHGAAWTFIVWGFMHAVAMVLSKFISVSKIAIPKAIGWMATFSFWVVSFAVFRAPSMKEALELFSRVFRGGMGRIDGLLYETIDNCVEISLLQRADILGVTEFCPEIFAVALLFLPLIGCLTMKNTQQKVQEFRFTYAKLFVTVGLLFYGLISLGRVTVFLYANF